MKKQPFTAEYFELLATATNDFATAYHYRVLMLLMTGTSYTQAQLAEKLSLKRQNVHRCIKDLEKHGYILVDKVEGRNKFLKLNTSVKDIRKIDSQFMEGQLEIDKTETDET